VERPLIFVERLLIFVESMVVGRKRPLIFTSGLFMGIA
jgi:hypothetical protein